MCDRKNYGCHAPESEVEAKTFNGVIEGYFLVVTEFYYKHENIVKQWDGIRSYH